MSAVEGVYMMVFCRLGPTFGGLLDALDSKGAAEGQPRRVSWC
jgi:hypothetical protein